MTDRDKILKALDIAQKHAMNDSEWHKQWVIDQMVRVLTGHKYVPWIHGHNKGEDGPETYSWDEGIAP